MPGCKSEKVKREQNLQLVRMRGSERVVRSVTERIVKRRNKREGLAMRWRIVVLECTAVLALTACIFACPNSAQDARGPVGAFEGSGDVGSVLHSGSVAFDVDTATYTVGGSGEN